MFCFNNENETKFTGNLSYKYIKQSSENLKLILIFFFDSKPKITGQKLKGYFAVPAI